MDTLAQLASQTWTGEALAGLAVAMILSGLLFPRWWVNHIIKERDAWKEQAQTQSAINEKLARAVGETVEPSRTLAKVVTSAQDRNEVPDEPVE